jgi:hypothetical protein
VVEPARRLWEDPETVVQGQTEERFFWRFFHPLAPRHELITISARSRLTGYPVFSIGIKGGLMVARRIEWRMEEAAIQWRSLAVATVIAWDLGAHLFVVSAGMFQHNPRLADSGWSPWRCGPVPFVYPRNRALGTAQHAFRRSAVGCGFDAFPSAVDA